MNLCERVFYASGLNDEHPDDAPHRRELHGTERSKWGCWQGYCRTLKWQTGPFPARRTLTCPYKLIVCEPHSKVNVTEEPPCPETPRSFPTKGGRLWTRRDSNPHPKTGQVSVLPLHHGPNGRLRGRREVDKVGCHNGRREFRFGNMPLSIRHCERFNSSASSPSSA